MTYVTRFAGSNISVRWPAPEIAVCEVRSFPDIVRTNQNFVVCNGRIEPQQESLVFSIIGGFFILRPGECLDCYEGVPRREDDKLSFTVVDSSQ